MRRAPGPSPRAALAIAVLLGTLAGTPAAGAETGTDELAKAEQNPLARTLIFPLQSTWSFGVGPNDETVYVLSIQPIIPVAVTRRWSLIARPVLPVVDTPGFAPGADREIGVSDLRTQLLVSPEKKWRGLIWGIGADLLFPTASADRLGTKKWGAGPAAALLRQSRGWTYGALVTQVWSYAGDDERTDVNAATFLGFLSYRLPFGLSFALRPTALATWEAEDRWTVPIDFEVRQIIPLSGWAVSVGGGVGYFVEKPRFEADWRARFILTFLVPRGGLFR